MIYVILIICCCVIVYKLFGSNPSPSISPLEEMLLKGKNENQKKVIRFFFGGNDSTFFQSEFNSRYKSVDLEKQALENLGIDRDDYNEIEPIYLKGFVSNDRYDNLVRRIDLNTYVTSDYMMTAIYFGEHNVAIYQYQYSLITDSVIHKSRMYAYNDIINISFIKGVKQVLEDEPIGCNNAKKVVTEYSNKHQESVEYNELEIILPGETFTCSMTYSNETVYSVNGMRSMWLNKKNFN